MFAPNDKDTSTDTLVVHPERAVVIPDDLTPLSVNVLLVTHRQARNLLV